MHIPVLQKEVLKYLDPKLNENFIDATISGGGHAFAILEKILPKGKLLGIDCDKEIIRRLKFKIQISPKESKLPTGQAKIKNNLILVCDNFANLKEIVKKEKFGPISGILLDLGLSSWHLEKSGRGFSFKKNESLIMRYDGKEGILTAEKILNEWPREEIERVLREYGEEKFAKRITKEIIEERKIRPIKTTFQLVEIIKRATPGWYHGRKIHPATKTFQALRIAVNDELNNLKKVLPQVLEVLEKGGRLVVISFHSLEDRIVKNFFRENSLKLKLLTKKPIRASREEIKQNRRSRSAKLRAAIKLR